MEEMKLRLQASPSVELLKQPDEQTTMTTNYSTDTARQVVGRVLAQVIQEQVKRS